MSTLKLKILIRNIRTDSVCRFFVVVASYYTFVCLHSLFHVSNLSIEFASIRIFGSCVDMYRLIAHKIAVCMADEEEERQRERERERMGEQYCLAIAHAHDTRSNRIPA